MWRFQHIDGQSEINELHVPLGRPVKVTFTSEDVLHSLFIPAFRVKADAIPGPLQLDLVHGDQEAGEYHLFCAEYCGTKHSGMIGTVIVMEPSDYQAWLSGGGGLSMTARGEQLFQQLGCVTCHLTDGRAAVPRSRVSSASRRRSRAAPRGRGRHLHPRVDPARRRRSWWPAISR